MPRMSWMTSEKQYQGGQHPEEFHNKMEILNNQLYYN